jgi:hypothetical protein
MKLYLVEIGDDHFEYKYLYDSRFLNLKDINDLLMDTGKCYPILTHNHHRLIVDCGGTILLHGRVIDNIKHKVWIIDADYNDKINHKFEKEFTQKVNEIIVALNRDIKIKSIYDEFNRLLPL